MYTLLYNNFIKLFFLSNLQNKNQISLKTKRRFIFIVRKNTMKTPIRPESMARITTPELAEAFIAEQIAAVRAQVGDKKVLLALSGGVDS
jgi:asparagine synthetase B (glutamine-hydrolysing)